MIRSGTDPQPNARRATRAAAVLLGAVAGGAGVEHGIFEMLRGPGRPDGLFIESIGPPCDPAAVWYACEPALTIVPDYLASGVLSIALGVAVFIWSLAFVQRRRGGPVLAALSLALLLVGGGIFPPLIGVVAGAVGSRIRAPLRPAGPAARRLAALWPWPLVAFLGFLAGQWLMGAVANDALMASGFAIPVAILGLLALAVASAAAHDRRAAGAEPATPRRS